MSGYNFVIDQHFGTKFCTEMENRQSKGFQCSEVGFSKIQDGRRPPFWISILGHNFGVRRSTFLRQIWYSEGKSAVRVVPAELKNQIFFKLLKPETSCFLC